MSKKLFFLLPLLSSGLTVGCGEACMDIPATATPTVTLAQEKIAVDVAVDRGGGGCGSVAAKVESYQWDLDADGMTDVEGTRASSIFVPRVAATEQKIGLVVQTNEGPLELLVTVGANDSWTWEQLNTSFSAPETF